MSSPYWIFGSTVERPRRPPALWVAATSAAENGSDVIAATGNATAYALNKIDAGMMFEDLSPTPDLDPER